ncbi:hypothetical protein RFI_13561, partial [Reticulomyxa filosa]
KCAKGQLDSFIAMLNKAHKSIRALTVTNEFDQITAFPIFPNLVHLNLQNTKISSCFTSVNVKGLMPQLKTLEIERLQMGSCKYCNWKQVLEAVEACDFNDDNASLLTPFSHSSSWFLQNQDCVEIRFLNHLLLSCPNLLALYYFGSHRTSEETLKIPATLEWLTIHGDVMWNGPFSVRLDLSQCKHINGLSLSWRPSFVKWPTETMLKIDWLNIGHLDDIKFWDDLLSSPTKRCDVQLCAVLSNMIIYDLTSDNSIFTLTNRSFVPAKPLDAERFLQCRDTGVVKFDRESTDVDYSDDESTEELTDNDDDYYSEKKNVIIKRPIPFFQNIVEAMGIDNTKVKEYQKWFDIDEASWILNLFCPNVWDL